MIFHPLQYPLARGLMARHQDCELWYWRWDRYEEAYDAPGAQRERLEELHERALERSALTFVVSDALGDVDRAEGRTTVAGRRRRADSFPAPDPAATVVACLARAPRPPHRLGAAARASPRGCPSSCCC